VELLNRFWEELAARVDGPFAMRIYVQPLMAAFLAFRDGMKDARKGNPAYFWSLSHDPTHRAEQIRSG
jgi:hypothetical protein